MAKPSKQAAASPILGAFGRAVRSVRLDKGISQEALADLAQLDRSYMGGIERGEHNLALINITKIAAALGMTVAELMAKASI